LRDVEALILPRQSPLRWWLVLSDLCSGRTQKDSWYSSPLEAESTQELLEGLSLSKNPNELNRIRTRDLTECSIVLNQLRCHLPCIILMYEYI
jgi:hypothetical protein